MEIASITDIRHYPSILIGSMRIGSVDWNVIQTLPMLSLISCDHIDRLLYQIEIILIVTLRGREVKVPVHEGL